MSAEKIIGLLMEELEDSISFMETFDKEALGDADRLEDKYKVMDQASEFLKKNAKKGTAVVDESSFNLNWFQSIVDSKTK